MVQSPVQSPPDVDPIPSPDPVPADTPTAQAPAGAQTNLPVFRTIKHNIIWHIWTVLSVATAIALIYLNFAEYVIGPELGRTSTETKAVLNILQFVAKAHEISMVLSIANIARQLIQGELISKKGTILALVGAEQHTSSPGVLVSGGYKSALKYGLRYFSTSNQNESRTVRGRRLVVLCITGFLLISAALCTTVGPSSAVLMVPTQRWFLRDTLAQGEIINNANRTSLFPLDDHSIGPGYPYLFVSPLEIEGASNTSTLMYWDRISTYWSTFGTLGRQRMRDGSSDCVQDAAQETHELELFAQRISVNSSTTLGRQPARGAKESGQTLFSTMMYSDIEYGGQANITYKATARNNRSPTRFITKLTAVTSSTVCRRGQRISCDNQRRPITNATNTTQWCFESATKQDSPRPPVFGKQDLLLLVDYQTPANDSSQSAPATSIDYLPRFWITEGPSHKDYADSIIFVFEFAQDDLIVCSNTASLTSATATFAGQLYEIYQAEYHSQLVYERNTGTPFIKDAQKFRFRKGWLDFEQMIFGAHTASWVLVNNTWVYDLKARQDYISNLLATPPSSRNATQTTFLRDWAGNILNSTNRMGTSVWKPPTADMSKEELKMVNRRRGDNNMPELPNFVDAPIVETVVGGPWITMLSASPLTLSQYMLRHDNYSYDRIDTPLPSALFKEGSLYEDIDDYRFLVYAPAQVYSYLYGYGLASVMGILAVAVLTTYMVVACCGSIWQLSRGGGIIEAWGSVPDYLMLGESTATEFGKLGYRAGVGGKSKAEFQCGVRVDPAASGDYYGIKLGDLEVSEVPVK